ncbi:hypothetical protein ACFS7Z_20755 [Pontibacter toksunensis]|uniref:Lipoprotein n=1 Tax=Pontibacter toksunensis TaxID=1332631 RepID=A0ABW6C022_9BACT
MRVIYSFIFLVLFGCSFPMSEYEANERLENFSLTLIEEPNFVENRRDLTHIDYYENIELLLSDSEYANLQWQIKNSKGFTNLDNYYKGLEDFKTKSWTYGEIFGQSHLSSKEVIVESDVIELAYYHKSHSGSWVEKINDYTKQPEYYKQVSGTDGGIISIFQNERSLFYYLQDD